MSKELVKRPDPVQFFDGAVCPLCERVRLRKDVFVPLTSRPNSHAYAFILNCYCMTVTEDETVVVGVVLESDAQARIANEPGYFLTTFTNFSCPKCDNEPKTHRQFLVLTSRGRTWSTTLQCKAKKCLASTNLIVVYRRYGWDEPIPEVNPLDLPPAQAELFGPVRTNEFLDVREMGVKEMERLWHAELDSTADRVHSWKE